MSEIIRQAIAELRAVGNIIHGPEVWLVFPLACLISGIVGFIVYDHWEDDDE